jgi:predicted secreted Zn-dependent protease
VNRRDASVALILFVFPTGCTRTDGAVDIPPVATASPDGADMPCGLSKSSALNDLTELIAMKVTWACYDVVGATPQAIRASLDANPHRPADPTSAVFDANTSWEFKLVWAFVTNGGACRAGNIATTLLITQTFPRWVPSDAHATTLRQEWNA